MKFKTVYCYHPTTGAFIGRDRAQESPREPGVFLFPKNSTETAPPAEVSEGYFLKFESGAWVEEKLPDPPAKEEVAE